MNVFSLSLSVRAWCSRTRFRVLAKSDAGVALVEFALLLPLFVAILVGVLEFGVYFTRSAVVSRAVSNISTAIQLNAQSTQSDAQNSGFGLVNFSDQGNYFCALSYSTHDLAAAGGCTNQWVVSAPVGHPANTPYYVAIVAFVKNTPITGLGGFLPDIAVRNIVVVGTPVASQPHGIALLNSGAGNWSIPSGVTQLKATIIGAGGGGGGPGCGGGAGGSGGGIIIAQLSGLTPGNSLPYVIGTGGATGNAGTATTFNGLVAGGGGTGKKAANGNGTSCADSGPGGVVATNQTATYGTASFIAFQGKLGGSSYRMGLGAAGADGYAIGAGGARGDDGLTNGSSPATSGGAGYGGGGGGGVQGTAGGAGASGAVILEW